MSKENTELTVEDATHPFRQGGWLYALTIFISAFLLFQVQPLISKFILPWFGGSPAVWTAAMLFFQSVLFGGYLYAHVLTSWLDIAWQKRMHTALLGFAVIVISITHSTPWEGLRPTGDALESPLFRVLLVLAASVGLPYFVLSSTGPLLQKWFSDAYPGASPYRLFALSNIGSLIALLSYPFFFEVRWGSVTQARMWSVGFVVFALGCAVCAWRTHRRNSALEAGSTQVAETTEKIHLGMRIAWIGLPALASVMFLAITNEVCQNVATVPLLWTIPLSLYLLSFIVAFDHPRWYQPTLIAVLTSLSLLLMTGWSFFEDYGSYLLNRLFRITDPDQQFDLAHNWIVECGVYFTSLFFVCVLCHGQLARLKPPTKYLTSYYMTMSLGGAVGGLLVNLAAPHLFKTFYELQLGSALSFIVAILIAGTQWSTSKRQRVESSERGMVKFAVLPVVVTILALGQGAYWLFIEDYFRTEDASQRVEHRSRNFYGILSVMHNGIGEEDENYTFFSGHIKHGMQLADPNLRREPLTYYGPRSGVGLAMLDLQSRKESCHLGVVGLGTGTLATYARATDRMRLYEINPNVVEIAKSTQWFHYLDDCRGPYEIVLGDARLQLERELEKSGSQKFDLLCLDAFSGDAIPTHLLTDEAFAIYRKHMAENGILAVHITNSYLDLYPIVEKLAEKHGWKATRFYRARDGLQFRNDYVLLTDDEDFLSRHPADVSEQPASLRSNRQVPLWTDQYSNLLQILL